MGGGPGGATLGALLGRRTKLSVTLVEKERFPREHIGESFIARLTVLLERSGALPKILASDCWIRKAGGFFDWDPKVDPYTLFFAHDAQQKDGIPRWALHVNRSEFDALLLDHARDSGVDVLSGTAVRDVTIHDGFTRVLLEGGDEIDCRVFVDASGRPTSVLGVPRAYLSSYRNIALWNHFVGCESAQTLSGEWNIFRDKDLSPAGNIACRDGWFWYIPVRKLWNGERILTHSVGLVTDPSLLKRPGSDFTDVGTFLEKCRETPRLRELMVGARPLSDTMSTATNYSMISEQLCSFDGRWMLLGDAAFFVDPLFSSGVTLAVSEAFSAAFVIEATFDPAMPELHQRDLWADYHSRYRITADRLASMIDQWYHAVGRIHPDSVYTRLRGSWPERDGRDATFSTLLDLSILDALLDLSIPGDEKQRWARFFAAGGPAVVTDPGAILAPARSEVRLRAGVTVRPGASLGTVQATIPGEYWLDPVASGDRFVPLVPFQGCHRFCLGDSPGAASVAFVNRYEGGLPLFALLSQGAREEAALRAMLSPPQRALLDRLVRAELVEVVPAG
jgi:flavin-dependent dehydrogenase